MVWFLTNRNRKRGVDGVSFMGFGKKMAMPITIPPIPPPPNPTTPPQTYFILNISCYFPSNCNWFLMYFRECKCLTEKGKREEGGEGEIKKLYCCSEGPELTKNFSVYSKARNIALQVSHLWGVVHCKKSNTRNSSYTVSR